MIQPKELRLHLRMEVANGVISTTTRVWEMLLASHDGNVQLVKKLADECPELIYGQYNYTPPVYFAVREGHVALVKYLLEQGAHDAGFRFYPFQESLETVANDRVYAEIEELLKQYAANPAMHRFSGDNGQIYYERTAEENDFEQAVYNSNIDKVKEILKLHPHFPLDETYFWSEGILLFAAKENNRAMIDVLTSYGAKVPDHLKWAQFYYFERLDGATYMMEKGMNPDTMSWQRVTLLHDMAQKGFIDKADLLLKYGAQLDLVDEAYQSTPLGLASRWGQTDMVKYLISKGANVNKAGKPWATPLTWARKKGHIQIEEILVAAGAKNPQANL